MSEDPNVVSCLSGLRWMAAFSCTAVSHVQWCDKQTVAYGTWVANGSLVACLLSLSGLVILHTRRPMYDVVMKDEKLSDSGGKWIWDCNLHSLLDHIVIKKEMLKISEIMEQTTSWEADSHALSEEITLAPSKSEVHFHVQQSLPLAAVLSQTVLDHRSFPTTLSQLKFCDFSGETFGSFEVL